MSTLHTSHGETPSTAATNATAAGISASPKITRGHSCIACANRKVKCDGARPCSRCRASSAECVSQPRPPRRGVRLSKNRNPLLRVVQRGSVSSHDEGHAQRNETLQGSGAGNLINDQGHSRFVDNHLWDGLNHELPSTDSVDEESTGTDVNETVSANAKPSTLPVESLIFGSAGTFDLSNSHPNPVRIFWLWQTYLENVNGAVKILHVPTTQNLIMDAVTNSSALPSNKKALLFCIYACALGSIPESQAEECQKMMGDSLSLLIERFKGLAQQALINASFLKSFSFSTIQAYVLFLLLVRGRSDPQTLWMLTGLALRSAQRLGLHREKALRGLTIFQAEMRRRLWWEVLHLESHAAKQCGVASHIGQGLSWDTSRPLNINDSDLHHNMKDPPKEHKGPTDMMLCSVRFEVGQMTMALGGSELPDKTLAQLDAEVDAVELRLHERILQYCDPSIPLHYVTLLLGRLGLARIKLSIRRKHLHANKGVGLSLQERDRTLELCFQLIETSNASTDDKSMERYLWQAKVFFPVDALLFVLSELAYRKASESLPLETVARAWPNIEASYKAQPRFADDRKNVMYVALCNLTIKAWSNSIARDGYNSPMPQFLQHLDARRSSNSTASGHTKLSPTPASVITDVPAATNQSNLEVGPSAETLIDDPEFWKYWEQFSDDNGQYLDLASDPSLALLAPFS